MSVAKLAFLSAAVVSSSALWQAFGQGTMPVETAMTRFAVVLVVSWIALTFVAELVFPKGGPLPVAQQADAAHPALGHDEAEGLDDDQPRPVPPTSMPNT